MDDPPVISLLEARDEALYTCVFLDPDSEAGPELLHYMVANVPVRGDVKISLGIGRPNMIFPFVMSLVYTHTIGQAGRLAGRGSAAGLLRPKQAPGPRNAPVMDGGRCDFALMDVQRHRALMPDLL